MNKTYDAEDLRRVAGIISEYMGTKLDVFMENVDTLITTKVRAIVQEELESELSPIKTDIKIIKAAVTETNKDQRKLEMIVGYLKAA